MSVVFQPLRCLLGRNSVGAPRWQFKTRKLGTTGSTGKQSVAARNVPWLKATLVDGRWLSFANPITVTSRAGVVQTPSPRVAAVLVKGHGTPASQGGSGILCQLSISMRDMRRHFAQLRVV